MKKISLLLISFIILSCTDSFKTEGTVLAWSNRPDPEFTALASELNGLILSEAPRNQSWNLLIKDPPTAPDLIVTELTQDVIKASSEGVLTDLSIYNGRFKSASQAYPGMAHLSQSSGITTFIPSSVLLWRLFYNQTVWKELNLPLPSDLTQLEAAFEKLQEKGIIPIALGSSFGWPALAWLSVLDLRYNGSQAHWALIHGKRDFSDPSFSPVFETLTRWRDKKYFDQVSGTINWPESLVKVQDGKAGFVFMGTSVVNRFGGDGAIISLPVPPLAGKKIEGELAGIQGFILNASSKFPEAALALVDTYISRGSKGQTSDSYRISATRPAKGVVLEGIKAHQAESLESGVELHPTLDRILEPQAAYDVNLVMIRFFAPGSTMTGGDLAEALTAAMRSSK